jgi:hypothetical protein
MISRCSRGTLSDMWHKLDELYLENFGYLLLHIVFYLDLAIKTGFAAAFSCGKLKAAR